MYASTWPKKVDFYRRFGPHYEPMLRLVEQIASSPYAAGTHPITSHLKLMVSQTRVWDFKIDLLEIEYNPQDKLFTFTFWERPRHEPWVTQCSSEDGFLRFEKCMTAKRWFAFETVGE